MRGLPAIASAEAFRVRRWDVLMLGAALPGLVAAARLGQRGLRVLILEEQRPDAVSEAMREPYLLSDGGSDGVMLECLRALGVPLIDQRRFISNDTALQVCDEERRVDVGRGSHTVEEWVSWGLCSLQEARAWVHDLDEAAEREREELLQTGFALGAARRAREAIAGPRRGLAARGWPESLSEAPAALHALLAAPLDVMTPPGGSGPTPEVRARLLGGLMRGGVSAHGEGGLRGLLRRRVETLYGEFRALDKPFHLVSVSGQPGLSIEGSPEIWSGRALVLNAPAGSIAEASSEEPPEVLRGAPIRWRRHSLHFRGPAEQLPGSMAGRVIWRDPQDGQNVALRVQRGRRRSDAFDLFASGLAPADDDAAAGRVRERTERCLRDLLPFSDGALEEVPVAPRRWDSDDWLPEPPRTSWPAEPELRLSSKPPLYQLDRSAVAGLGGEGELWLGWRAGDAIRDELA